MDSLVNTMHGYIILMLGADVITIYIFLQFFENLPVTLDESAIIDGCSYFGAFFRILFPLLKPAIVTSAILKGVSPITNTITSAYKDRNALDGRKSWTQEAADAAISA